MNEKWKEVDERVDKLFNRTYEPEEGITCTFSINPDIETMKEFTHAEIEQAVSKLHTDLDMEMAYKRGARELAERFLHSPHKISVTSKLAIEQALASLESETKGEKK
jgi:hypothetical protein